MIKQVERGRCMSNLKCVWRLLLFLFVTGLGWGQEKPDQWGKRYWIFFHDKGTQSAMHKVGFQDGLEAEREKHKQQLEAHAQQFRELSERLEEEFDQALSRMEEPLLRMSFSIAEKILTASLPEDYRNESLVGVIQSFLKEVLHEGGVVVHVAPEKLAFIQSEPVSEKLQQSYPGRIRFVANDTLKSGECLVETPEHIIDGRYHNQLEILESKLR